MGERKVLCKYFPPDFDPKKVPRMKRDPEKQIGVRMMIPFSMQCNTCGEFMYRGKKFNSLKEDCIGEDYLGIRRFRFYIKCVICSQEITFKTDPEKGDYELETGASRNFESWTDKQATEEEHKKAREEEEKSDNMKQLENRTLDSKIELEIMDALDEIKAVNRRHETVDTSDVLKASAARRAMKAAGLATAGTGEDDEDDAMVANIRFGGPQVRRLAEEDSDSDGTGSTSVDNLSVDTPGKEANGGGLKGNGKKKHVGKAAAVEGAPKFQPTRKSGDGIGVPSSARDDARLGEQDGEDDGAPGDVAAADAPGSSLVSAIEAQARREAEKAKAATAGSTGTKVIVKRKKKRDKVDSVGGGGAADTSNKKQKKHKKKDKEDCPKNSENGSAGARIAVAGAGAAATAPVSVDVAATGAAKAAPLGGLNLLGSYDSSSGSDGGGTP